MLVVDPALLQERRQLLGIELRIPPRPRNAPRIRQHLDALPPQQLRQFPRLPCTVPNRENLHSCHSERRAKNLQFGHTAPPHNGGMRVAIVGAGAISGLVGGLLGRAGHELHLLARGANLDALKGNGLRVRSAQFGNFEVAAQATAEPAELGPNDLVVVAVKMYDFAAAAQSARQALASDGLAVTFQNGLDAPAELADVVGPDHVVTGTIAGEVTLQEPGIVAHLSPHHAITLSSYASPPTPRLDQVAAAMKEAGLNVAVVDDGMRALWQKACGLIPFATITAASGAALGEFMAEPASRDLWEALLGEITAVADSTGYDVRQAIAGWRNFALRGVETTPGFTSSLARDLQAGRRTELEWLTGKIVRLAAQKGVPAPAHRALYAILKLKEGANVNA